jgi:hypothetical protein
MNIPDSASNKLLDHTVQPFWHVDQQNGTATIHPLDEPNNKQNVAVSSLIEQ